MATLMKGSHLISAQVKYVKEISLSVCNLKKLYLGFEEICMYAKYYHLGTLLGKYKECKAFRTGAKTLGLGNRSRQLHTFTLRHLFDIFFILHDMI